MEEECRICKRKFPIEKMKLIKDFNGDLYFVCQNCYKLANCKLIRIPQDEINKVLRDIYIWKDSKK